MRTILRVAVCAILISISAQAQNFISPGGVARRFVRVTSVPASCTAGDVLVDVSASPAVYYNCPVATPVAFLSGTITAANGGTGQSTYTKGDMLAAPGGATLNKVAVGADGFVWTADAASTNGVKWAAVSGGANTALSNLASVAVNTPITPASDGSTTLGSTSVGWASIVLSKVAANTQQVKFKSISGGGFVGIANGFGYTDAVGPFFYDDNAGGGVSAVFTMNLQSLTAARTVIWPDLAGTVALTSGAQTFTSKTYTDAITGGTTPAVSNTTANSCGTSAATIAGNNTTGVITVGATAGTNCTITFTVAAPTRRQCTVTNETTANLSRSTFLTTTTSTVEGTFAASDKISYVCAVY